MGSEPAAYRDWNEYIVVSSLWLLWLPVLSLAFFGKGELSQYGLARGDGKQGALLALGMYLLMLPICTMWRSARSSAPTTRWTGAC